MLVRIQNEEGFVNREKPRILVSKKTKYIMKPTSREKFLDSSNVLVVENHC